MVRYLPGSGVLEINVPKTLIPAINKYNSKCLTSAGGPINIAKTCIDALWNELKKRGMSDDKANTMAQKGTVMGETNRSIWVCHGCFTVITNMEYEHFNQTGSCDGCCRECGNVLNQYEEVK